MNKKKYIKQLKQLPKKKKPKNGIERMGIKSIKILR